MPYNIKAFQSRYGLTNKDVANICHCSLPTIQKWRSGEVPVSGAASQLMGILDNQSQGNPAKLWGLIKEIDQEKDSLGTSAEKTDGSLESSMDMVVDRLEFLLESRRKEKELAKSEARYRSMVDSYSNPVCRWLPDTTLTFTNEAYLKLFSKDGERIIGKKWIDFLPEDIRESYTVIVSDMVRRGEEEIWVHDALTSQGEPITLEWRDIPIKDDAGKVVELHSIGSDVTELVELRRKKEECSLTKRALFDLSPAPIAVINEEGQFIETSALFHAEFIGDRKIPGMSDLLTAPVSSKLKRLLKRVGRNDSVCFQLKLDYRRYRMNGRLISRDDKQGSKYLIVLEELSELESRVISLRLGNEIILDGQVHQLLFRKETIDKIQIRMNEIGNALDLDRVYVFTFDWEDETFTNILEWCARGVDSHIDELQKLPMSDYPWWTEKLTKDQWIRFEDTTKMPRSAYREREILTAQKIRSIMVAPLVVNSKAQGFAGFDHINTPRVWHSQEQKVLEEFKTELEQILSEAQATGKEAV